MPKSAETVAAEPAPKKRLARRRAAAQAVPVELTWETVAPRAYYLHLEGGDDPLENWLRAERELLAA